MPPVLCALEFYDDEMTLSVDGQQVDASPGVLPLAELLGDHQQFIIKDTPGSVLLVSASRLINAPSTPVLDQPTLECR